MNRILVVKASSMGDIIHTFPAVSDAIEQFPQLTIDWLVEESFKDLPHWHPAVNHTLPVTIREWKKNPFRALSPSGGVELWRRLRTHTYDRIIDAQGLLKTALLSRWARGKSVGFAKPWVREPWAAAFYHIHCHTLPRENVVSRIRRLFATALDYPFPEAPPAYGLLSQQFPTVTTPAKPYLLFLHGTTWPNKHYPETYWNTLATHACQQGKTVCLLWSNHEEKARAERIATHHTDIHVLPKMTLSQAAGVVARAEGVVGLDTGLGHLAMAFNVPTVLLWGPSDAELSGATVSRGMHYQSNFPCSPCVKRVCLYPGEKPVDPPCFSQLPPHSVWDHLTTLMEQQ